MAHVAFFKNRLNQQSQKCNYAELRDTNLCNARSLLRAKTGKAQETAIKNE